MKIKQKIITLIFSLILIPSINASEVKIIFKVNNEIITNIDIENEIKYLKVLNSNVSKLKYIELKELSKNSLIRHIIKKEVSKYFDIKNNLKLGENLIKNKYKADGYKNKSDYLILNFKYLQQKLMKSLKKN